VKNALVLLLPLLLGCQQAYYQTMEQFGYHKREIMVDRVGAARDSQEEAKEQFQDALEKFGALIEYDGGNLEKLYDRLSGELDQSKAKASSVRQRIDGVEDVSEALFDEWETELDQYSSESLRAASQRRLKATKVQYRELVKAMRRAEAKMDPVLAALNDQVLFLKHNLNARAVASLEGELAGVESDVAALIRDMEASIAEADAFIETLSH
jgi:hypothetical protein